MIDQRQVARLALVACRSSPKSELAFVHKSLRIARSEPDGKSNILSVIGSYQLEAGDIGPRWRSHVRRAAAVIIGVDKTGELDPLKSAARGAREFATWLESEGFDVACLTDGPGRLVTSQEVSAAITKFATKPPMYDILVIYFSGHGQWHTRADHWLLSGAPTNTAEAINLEGAMYTARRCGIPNVVFISDACRTIPKAEVDSLVIGVDGFPNHAIPSITKIDYFKATSESRPAYEIPISGTDQSVLTRAILSAFENPEPQIVKQIPDGVQTLSIVPNRLLESVLQARVDAILDGVDGNPIQDLDTNVPSADHIYIARVREKAPPAPGEPPPAAPPPRLPTAPGGPSGVERPAYAARRGSVRMVPGRAAADAVSDTLRGVSTSIAALAGVKRDEIDKRIPDPRADHFETETGFIIRGARLADAAVSPNARSEVELLNTANDPRGDAVRVHPSEATLPVVVRLADGRCAVLAALRGYLGHAQFDKDGLANVAYVPSSNNWRWGAYNARRDDIDRLRALVALAVEHNAFRVRSEKEAGQLAERIRVEKALDPTLGLYAAYAFAQAGIDAQVRDILRYMREDLGGVDLFDVLMLSGEAAGRMSANPPVPFCPMLTQGWNLLRAYGVQLPEVLARASQFLSNSLWSTFTGRGASIVFNAIKSGEL